MQIQALLKNTFDMISHTRTEFGQLMQHMWCYQVNDTFKFKFPLGCFFANILTPNYAVASYVCTLQYRCILVVKKDNPVQTEQFVVQPCILRAMDAIVVNIACMNIPEVHDLPANKFITTFLY